MESYPVILRGYLIALGIVHWKKQHDVGQIEANMKTTLQTMTKESTPWWVDGMAPEMESTVQSDLIAANDARNTDRSMDWHHEEAPVLGSASQSGLFSRKSNGSRVANDACVVDHSARSTVGYGW